MTDVVLPMNDTIQLGEIDENPFIPLEEEVPTTDQPTVI